MTAAFALIALGVGGPPLDAETILVKDAFATDDFDRKVGDRLDGVVPGGRRGDAKWRVTVGASHTVFSARGGIVASAAGASSEARVAIPAPGNIVTVSAMVTPSGSDWVAVGFLPSADAGSRWLANDGGGASVWLLLRPDGQWTLFSDGTGQQLLGGGPASYPSVIFTPGARYTLGVSYDPVGRRARPFIRDGDTEAGLFPRDNGWIDTRLPAGASIGAAGFRINATGATLAGEVSVRDFLVTEAGAGTLRFTQLPAGIRARIATGTPRSSAEIVDSPFGIHTTIMNEGGSPELIEKLVALISEGGFKWAVDYLAHSGRTAGMTPAQVEQMYAALPERCIDYARRLQAAKVNLLVRLDPFPWTPHGKEAAFDYAPGSSDMLRASAFIRQTVRQLKPYTRHWQIWNEPNLGNAVPYVTPESYVKLFAQIAAVIRSEQPDAVLYGPGTAMLQCLADSPYPWIPRALDAGLLDHVDVFTFHPYRQPAVRDNIPEHASEFHPWNTWKTYANQIADLRARLRGRAKGGRDVPIAATEDGLPDLVNGAGEQQISWVVGAKYELRRALLDFRHGVNPRTLFCLYRPIGDLFYNEQSSYSVVTADFQKKPAYNAAQNLNAVLDSSYSRADDVPVRLTLASASSAAAPLEVHAYRKDHGNFEELLVFFWSAEPGGELHVRHPASLRIDQSGWQAPLLIDLMSMPVRRPRTAPVEIIDSKFVDRRDPEPMSAVITEAGVAIDRLEVRDYPLLIKWVRMKP